VTRSLLTPSERVLAMDLLGGTPAESIAITGRASIRTAAIAYEWLRYLAIKAEPSDEAAINHLYLLISLVERDGDGLGIVSGVAA